jgi:hypothetical protein
MQIPRHAVPVVEDGGGTDIGHLRMGIINQDLSHILL